MKELRASLYFSKRKDKDIIKALDFFSLEQGDISWEIKSLMRDGIKYRNQSNTSSNVNPLPVIQTSSIVDLNDFDGIEVEVEKLKEEDITNKLENF